MTDDDCAEMTLLVQADVDGELRPAEAARVAAHIERCPRCAALQTGFQALSSRLAADAPRHRAPDALRAAIRAAVPRSAQTPPPRRWRTPILSGASFGAGLALAASVALVTLPQGGGELPEAVVSAHIRGLQPGHLMDVVSTDQHTVKPWFDGRLPFAPPVRDTAASGFALAGGRLDYLAGRAAGAMIYRHGQHIVSVFAWPGPSASGPSSGNRDGYNFVRWSQNGMVLWAVSDVSPEDLAAFVRDWKVS